MTSSTTLFALSVNVSQFMLLPSVDPGPAPESCQPLWSNVAVFRLLARSLRISSFVNSSIPQSVWWMTNHSRVPSSLYEITSDRMASSLARPPAFRITWASPSVRPAYFAGSSRASIQVRIAKWRLGGSGRLPWSPKLSAYLAFAASTSSRILVIAVPPVRDSDPDRASGKWGVAERFLTGRRGAWVRGDRSDTEKSHQRDVSYSDQRNQNGRAHPRGSGLDRAFEGANPTRTSLLNLSCVNRYPDHRQSGRNWP